MTYSSTVKINIDLVKQRILDQDLKKTWIADHIGITKAGFFDWLNGKVKKVRYHNAKALASCLGMELHQIVIERQLRLDHDKQELTGFSRKTGSRNYILDYIGTYILDYEIKRGAIKLLYNGDFEILEDLIQNRKNYSYSPADEAYFFAIGNIFFLQDKYYSALTYYKKAYVSNKSSSQIILRISYIQGILGFFNEAKQMIKINIPDYEKNIYCCNILADILFEQGEYHKSSAILKNFLVKETLPQTLKYSFLILLARNYLMGFELKIFESILKKIPYPTKDSSINYQYLYLSGLCQTFKGNLKKSQSIFENCKSIFLQNKFHDPKFYIKLIVMRARLKYIFKDYSASEEILNEGVLILKKHFKPLHFLQFEIENLFIEIFICTQKYSLAKKRISIFERICFSSYSQSHIKQSIVSFLKGKLYQSTGDIEKAIQYYLSSLVQIEKDTHKKFIYLYLIKGCLAECYTYIGQLKKAQVLYESIVELSLKSPKSNISFFHNYYIKYSDLLSKNGDHTNSFRLLRKEYRKLIRNGNLSTVDTNIQYGKNWIRLKKFERAISFFNTALKESTDRYRFYKPKIFLYLGICHIWLGNYRKALTSLNKIHKFSDISALTNKSSFIVIEYLMALILTTINKPSEATNKLIPLLNSDFKNKYTPSSFTPEFIYYFLGINNFLLNERVDSQFYLKKFIDNYSNKKMLIPEFLERDMEFSKFLLNKMLTNNCKISIKSLPLKTIKLENYFKINTLI